MNKNINLQILIDNEVAKEVTFDYPEELSDKELIKSIQAVLTNPIHKSPTPDEIFSFAIGNSWIEIKDIFQYNLIMFHKNKASPGSDAYKSLGMNKPTFYSAHRKLANKGYSFPDYRMKVPQSTNSQIIDSLQSYIKNLEESSWVAASKQFEEDVLRFLYHQYGYKKTKLAEELGLGYSAVIEKTKWS